MFCSGELAAWMVQSYYGAMFSMQTRPEFRRRGYGILLAKKLMNLVTERGYIPYVVIRPENDASKSLYTKLGFRKIYQTARVVFKPYNIAEERISGEKSRVWKVSERPTKIFYFSFSLSVEKNSAKKKKWWWHQKEKAKIKKNVRNYINV